MSQFEWTARTRAIVAGRPTGPGEPMNQPIVAASTFHAGGDRSYAREDGTPTWAALEEVVGGLEGGMATAFSSGMGAVSAVFDLLPVDARVMVPRFSYVGTRGLLRHARETGRFTVTELVPTDTDAWLAGTAEADLLWLESPTNPTLDLMDITGIARRAASQSHRPIVVVDNTFATPLGQQPLALGADLVVHSGSKLIGGHSDLLLGLVITAGEGRHDQLRAARLRTGATPGALEAYLALRGLRTLPVRLAEASATAAELAARLAEHPAVRRVRYPGSGTMLAFELADAVAADRLCSQVRLIEHGTSLGGVESLLERRAGVAGDAHVPAGLIRFSVGLEDPADLWRDLESALAN